MKHVWVIVGLSPMTKKCEFCGTEMTKENEESCCPKRGTDRWRQARSFLYKKREYYVIFERCPTPILCWPNAGHYNPTSKMDASMALGEALLVWDGDNDAARWS